jgi:hypothetical protein
MLKIMKRIGFYAFNAACVVSLLTLVCAGLVAVSHGDSLPRVVNSLRDGVERYTAPGGGGGEAGPVSANRSEVVSSKYFLVYDYSNFLERSDVAPCALVAPDRDGTLVCYCIPESATALVGKVKEGATLPLPSHYREWRRRYLGIADGEFVDAIKTTGSYRATHKSGDEDHYISKFLFSE